MDALSLIHILTFKGAGGMLSIAMILVFGFTMGTVVGELGKIGRAHV